MIVNIYIYRGPGACWQSAKMEEDAGNYLYNLVGILVHAGVAQGGHYYSYIRDRGRNASQGDGKPQVDIPINTAGNDNGSSTGIPLERGSSLGASSVSSEGVDEGKVKCMFMGGGDDEGRENCSRADLSSSFIYDTQSRSGIATSGAVEMLRVSACPSRCYDPFSFLPWVRVHGSSSMMTRSLRSTPER